MRKGLGLGLAAIGVVAVSAACAGQPRASAFPPVPEVVVSASEFKFEPALITLRKGESVALTLKNAGTTEHDLLVPGLPMPPMGGASSGGHGGHGGTTEGRWGTSTCTPAPIRRTA
jgi:hypothetical protein